MVRRWWSPLVAAVVLMLVMAPRIAAQSSADRLGVLVIAHGAGEAWNAPVLSCVEAVRREMPAAVGFLMGTGPTPQDAYDSVVRQGATRIVVVPLLISAHSAHFEQIRFLAGQRPDYPHAEHMALSPITGPVPIVGVTPAMNDDARIADILADRAHRLSQDARRETLMIVAHGPNSDDDARIWLDAMQRLAARVQRAVGFAATDVRLLRDDAPKPVKDLALVQLREAATDHARDHRVVVVPLLLSPGQVADEIPTVLEGLPIAWDGRTLLPDDRLAGWIVSRATSFQASAVPGQADAASTNATELAGTVRDSAGLPAASAVVVLRRASSGISRSITVGASGAFSFRGVAAGTYEVVVSLAGFAPVRESVTVPTGRVIAVDLHPLIYQEAITVVSDARRVELRDSATLPVTIVGGQAMRDAGDATAADALQNVAGVVARRGSEGAEVGGEQVQGLDSREVLVLMDGQPVVGARGIKSGFVNLDEQPVHALDRIEILRGAASALYGSDAIGGVINLIPRDPRRPLELSGTVAGGSFGAANASADLGGVARWGTWSVGGGRHARDAFDLTPSTPDTTGAAFRRTDANGRVTFALSPAWAITGTATSYWNRRTGQSFGELGLEADRTDVNAQTYGARAAWQADRATSVEFRAYRGRYAEQSTGSLLDSGTAVEPGDLFEGLTKFDASFARVLDAHQQLRGGVEWMRDAYRGHNRLRDADGEQVTTGSGWAEYRVSPVSRLTVTAGLRADAHSVFGSAVSPKLAAVERLTPWLTGRVAFSRGFRAPDLGQLYYRFLNPTSLYQVIGNPHLEPERSTSWQGGFEARWGTRAHASVNLYRNDVRHLIQAVNLGYVATSDDLDALTAAYDIAPDFDVQIDRLLFLYENVARARTRGVDLAGDVRFGSAWRLSGSYAFIDAIDAVTGAALANRSRHQGAVRLDWAPWRLGLRANLRGAFYGSWIAGTQRSVAGTSSIIAPRFARWDLTVSKTLRRPVDVFLAIDNLTDSQDPHVGLVSASGAPLPIYRPEIGRTFQAGVRWNWSWDR